MAQTILVATGLPEETDTLIKLSVNFNPLFNEGT